MEVPLPTIDTTSRPLAWGYHAALDDLLLRLAVGPETPLTIESAELSAPQFTTSDSPEDFTESDMLVYARSDFSGGAGLDWAHRRNALPTDFSRFFDSVGVGAERASPGERSVVQLLPAMERVASYTGSGRAARLGPGKTVAVSAGETVRVCANPTAATLVLTTETPATGNTVNDLAALGGILYAAMMDAGLYERSPAGAWSLHADSPPKCQRVWAVKERIMASNGQALHEVTGVTPEVPIHNLETGQYWTEVGEGGTGIMAAASDGYCYVFADEEGVLVLVSQYKLPVGEVATSIGWSNGLVFFATTTEAQPVKGRWYVGQMGGQQIGGLQLVVEWDNDFTARGPSGFQQIRDSVYTCVPAEGGGSELWRYDLITAGVFRDRYFVGVVKEFSVIDDRFHGAALDGWYREKGVATGEIIRVDEGYLISAMGDFYSVQPKAWMTVALEYFHDNPGLDLSYSTHFEDLTNPDSDSWVHVLPSVSNQGRVEGDMINVVGRGLAVKIRIRGQDSKLYAFSVRARPSAEAREGGGDLNIEIPVNISDQIEVPYRKAMIVKGHGERVYRALQSYQFQPVTLQLFALNELIRGQVEQISTPIPVMTHAGSTTLVCNLLIRGRRSGYTGAVSGPTFGSGCWGCFTWGGLD